MHQESLNPFTAEEHLELSQEMRTTVRRLRELAGVIVGVYGPNSEVSVGFQRVVKSLEKLQKDLRTQAAEDLPGVPVDELYN